MLILDLPGIRGCCSPEKPACGVWLWLGTTPVAPAPWWRTSGIPKCLSTAGDSPGQYISRLWVTQKEIRVVIPSPYHPVFPPQGTSGLQATVRFPSALAAKTWAYHQIWIFFLTSSSSESCVMKLVQWSARGYLYLHPKLQPRSPPSHTDKPWRWLVPIFCLTQLKTLSSDM